MNLQSTSQVNSFISSAAKTLLLPALASSALVVGAAPAQAAACSSYAFLQDLINAGGICNQLGASGPVTFTYVSHSGFNASDYTFNTSGTGQTQASFGIGYTTTPFGVGTYNLSYSLAHNTKAFNAISNALSSSLNLNANAGTYQVVSTGSSANLLANLNGANQTNGSYSYPSATLLAETFNSTLTVTTGDVENFSATYNFADPAPVPGPLPLLGASAALGFSRKLRNRLKSKLG